MLVPALILTIPIILIGYVLIATFLPRWRLIRFLGDLGVIAYHIAHMAMILTIVGLLAIWAYHTYKV